MFSVYKFQKLCQEEELRNSTMLMEQQVANKHKGTLLSSNHTDFITFDSQE